MLRGAQQHQLIKLKFPTPSLVGYNYYMLDNVTINIGLKLINISMKP